MSSQPNYIKRKYGPLREKTLRNALAHQITKEFPRIGGSRICQLCADMILDIVFRHLRSKDHVVHGQALWMAVSVGTRPKYRQRIADVDLVPVLLDISTAEDAQLRIDRVPESQRLLRKALRLCEQAHKQGGLLSNCDLAELLFTNDQRIAQVLTEHERLTNTLVPRRATLHDVGTGLTHKRIICWKRYAEGKDSQTVARETYHSIEAVDRYIGQYDRVRHCRLKGLTPEQTAHILGCSLALVKEYLAIDDLLKNDDT
jgi:DNA-binding CsgD family transcriptional regulator